MIYFDLELSDFGLTISTDWFYTEFNWLSIATATILVIGFQLWKRRK
jgi:hypothetical protein